MSLWADKYRPRSLIQLTYHESITHRLRSLAFSSDFPHLLIYGPSGAGKKTRVLATLHELYGSCVEKLKVDVKTFITPSNRKLEFNVISSPNHLEITPSDMGNNDRIVIQDLLQEVAQVESIDFSSILTSGCVVETESGDQQQLIPNKKHFKVVVINEAELLTRDAQAALRRTMEKYSANIRIILVCNSTSNIINPIKSRTLSIKIPAPTLEEASLVFSNILTNESQASKVFPESENDKQVVFENVCQASDRNLRMGIMMLEALYMSNDIVTSSTLMIIPDWQVAIKDMAGSLCKERNVSKLRQIRSTMYELLAHSIPAKLILKRLTFDLWEFINKANFNDKDGVKFGIVEASSTFDERLSQGSKAIFHLEGFITKVMMIMENDLLN